MKTANTLYTRYASDVTESVFNSIYDDLFKMAERDQQAKYKAAINKKNKLNKIKYEIGESQIMLNEWCKNKMSLGMVLDFIKTYKDYV